jgi:PAS domain S-box-containing protein
MSVVDPPGRDGAARTVTDDRHFQLLVNSVQDYAIYTLDPAGCVDSWNVGAERLKGYTAAQAVGLHVSVFYTAEDRARGLPERLLREARDQGRVAHSGWRVRRDGTRFWADVVITAVQDHGGLTGYAKVTRDMTEHRRALQERDRALAEARRSLAEVENLLAWRQDVTAALAHDLANPLTAIAGFADVLLDHDVDDDVARDLIERIASNARRVSAMVEQLRTHVRLSAGDVQLEPEVLPLADVLDHVVADLGPVIAGHRIDVDCGDLAVMADRGAVERIVGNLLGNAARHTPRGAAIRVRATSVGPALVALEVADEGEGIPGSLLPHVFERFTKGPRGGTGLGLSIVRELTEMHGGTVEVASPVGEGARFRVTLPRAAAAAPGAPGRG